MIWYFSKDNANNTELQKNFIVKIDKELPTIVTSRQHYFFRIKFTSTVNDTVSGIDKVEYYLEDPNGNKTLECTDSDGSNGYHWNLHPIPQGDNWSVWPIVYDIAGNSAYTNNSLQPQHYIEQFLNHHPFLQFVLNVLSHLMKIQ